MKKQLPSIINLQPPPNEAENFLLRSIEWTTFTEETYALALEHATVILRYFLGMRMTWATLYVCILTAPIEQVPAVSKQHEASLPSCPLIYHR